MNMKNVDGGVKSKPFVEDIDVGEDLDEQMGFH